MRITPTCLPYLEGKAYAPDLKVTFEATPLDKGYKGRVDLLCRLCRDKKVIHLGCVDHNADTIQAKLARGKWLHKELCAVARRCVGVDLEKDGIAFIQKLGYPEVFCGNILTDEIPPLKENGWDYLLIPEVLEHIGNPVSFLSGIRERMGGNFEKLLVSVPNAFVRHNFSCSRRGIEAINSDHRYWFTPYTLCKVLFEAGFNVDELVLCKRGRVKRWSIIRNLYYQTYPLLRDNLVAIARVRS